MSNKDTFNRWTLKDPRRISALFAGKGRRGIYVLEYADGSMYVGQATDVVGRYNSHYHGSGHHEAWEDVVALRFAEVPAGQDLNEPERAEIHRLQAKGIPLRNRQFVLDSVSPSPMDQVVTVVEQEHWIQGHESVCRSDFESHPLRQRIRPGKFKSWSKKKRGRPALYDAVLNDLAIAIGCLIPAPLETDGHYWTLSDFPSTSGGRFATLNTGRLEFLYFPRWTFGDWYGAPKRFTAEQLECFPGNLNIEYYRSGGPHPSLKIEKRLKNSYLWSKGIANYIGRGRPTQRVSFPIGHLGDLLLERPDVTVRAREFALTEMRYTGSNLFRRWHSRDFTDDVYRRVKQSSEIINAVNAAVSEE